MKKLNICMVTLLMGILVFGGSVLCQSQEDIITNTQLANMLTDILGLTMPADADTLTEAELFEIQANMLAERGITLFVDADPDAQVTRGAMADVLYGGLSGPSGATTQDKIDYLADLGYISTGGEDDLMSFGDVTAVLNVPALSTAIADAYSPPTADMGAEPDAPPTAPTAPTAANPAPETPASPI